jgi:hypothetical protein
MIDLAGAVKPIFTLLRHRPNPAAMFRVPLRYERTGNRPAPPFEVRVSCFWKCRKHFQESVTRFSREKRLALSLGNCVNTKIET